MASRASAASIACCTFLFNDSEVVKSEPESDDGGRADGRETNEAAAGRSPGYVTTVEVASVSGTDVCERELTLLTLDLAADRALDLELASADSFDFFSPVPFGTLPALRAL